MKTLFRLSVIIFWRIHCIKYKGYFDLDPNRVLDVIISAYECDPHNICYIELIKTFKKSSVPQILGFKF